MLNLIELQNRIHQQNREMGWWDNPRPFATMVCLFHSELSEAMEGDRKSLMDDRLPQYPMFQVELADFVIRCLDYLGSVGWDWNEDIGNSVKPESDPTELLADAHCCVSCAFKYIKLQAYQYGASEELATAVNQVMAYAELKGFDLETIINEKVAYNRTRADHQRAARAAENGKKY